MAGSPLNPADLTALKSQSLSVGGRTFKWGERTFLMGILNLTPDSFSGDGILAQRGGDEQPGADFIEAAVQRARGFVAAGVDILDVGGESTRPGSEPVGLEDELQRVIPVITRLAREFRAEFQPPLISIDTYKAAVAQKALEAGAHLINDVWGLRADPQVAQVAARMHAPLILMHNRSSWAHAEIKEGLGGRYIGMAYDDLIGDIRAELLESVEIAQRAGVPDEHLILDPGIGFGKTVEQNLELIDRLAEIRSLGYPVLLGPSRKSFIGYTLDLPPDQRLEGTIAAAAIGIARGADILRIHDVQPIARAVRMTDAIVRR